MKWNFKVICNATYKECNQMLEMAHESFQEKVVNIFFFKNLADYGKIFAAFDRDTPICVIQTMKKWDNPENVQIISIAVHTRYQRLGVCTFTAQEMIKHLQSEGLKSLGILIPPNHSAVLAIFQRKLGFKISETFLKHFGLLEDRVYLEKIL